MKIIVTESYSAHQHLVAAAAHDLRHPLVPLQNAAALLRRESLDAGTIGRAADIIEGQVSGMNRLIGDLVEVSRIQMVGLELRLARAPLSELMERVLESAAPVESGRGQELMCSMPPEPVYLHMDVLRVAQALHSLIGNASRQGHAQLRARREGAQAIIVVSDLGPGSRETEPAGRLGLYLARCLVEAHGGTITVESAGPGLGTVFTVRLPCELPVAVPLERSGAEPAGDLIHA